MGDHLQLQMPIKNTLCENQANHKQGITIRLPSLDFQGPKPRIQTRRQKEDIYQLPIAEIVQAANKVLTQHSHWIGIYQEYQTASGFVETVFSRLTGSVTCGWAGGENAVLPEPTSSHEPARKRGDSHPSGARGVGLPFDWKVDSIVLFSAHQFKRKRLENLTISAWSIISFSTPN